MASTVSRPWSWRFVGLELVVNAYASAFLPKVEEDALALARDGLHGEVLLLVAVAPQALEDVPGQAPAVHPDENRLVGVDVAHDEGDVVVLVHEASEMRWP